MAEIRFGVDERTTIMLPAFGFKNELDAQAYADGPQHQQANVIFGDSFKPIRQSRGHYFPRMGTSDSKWDVNELMQWAMSRYAQSYHLLRKVDVPMPAPNAYNVMLILEGARQFTRHAPRKGLARHQPWKTKLASGTRDCFVAWSRPDGSLLGHALQGDLFRKVWGIRAGRGVIYSRELLFGHSAQKVGIRHDLVLVEFQMRDRDETKDDQVRVSVRRSFSIAGEVKFDNLDEGWTRLIERARDGFNQHCKEVRPDVEAWRQRFVEQSNLYTENHEEFRASIERMNLDFQDALALVTQPWQMLVVVKKFADARFDYGVGRCETHSTRVDRMLSEFCSSHRFSIETGKEKLAELRQMVTDLVAMYDNTWNYSGD